MLGMIGKILCIVGLILLILLLLVICILLLVLFFPISYEIKGEKGQNVSSDLPGQLDSSDQPDWKVSAGAKWLFGLLKVLFAYPDPGTLIIRVAGIKIYDSGTKKNAEPEAEGSSDAKKSSAKAGSDSKAGSESKTGSTSMASSNVKADSKNADKTNSTHVEKAAASGNKTDPTASGTKTDSSAAEDSTSSGEVAAQQSKWEKLTDKIKKICNKIKETFSLVKYYISLLNEEDTKQLFAHAFTRLRSILKSIRPRKIKGNLLIGTGSPDTTGYVMALYGILSPQLGQNLTVTPDFEEKVLEGNLYIKGRVTIGTLAYHGVRVLLDRRLRTFIKKMKREVK